jgi:hypothetical protein
MSEIIYVGMHDFAAFASVLTLYEGKKFCFRSSTPCMAASVQFVLARL